VEDLDFKYRNIYLSRRKDLDLIESTIEESMWLGPYEGWICNYDRHPRPMLFKLLFLTELYNFDKCGGEYCHGRMRDILVRLECELRNV